MKNVEKDLKKCIPFWHLMQMVQLEITSKKSRPLIQVKYWILIRFFKESVQRKVY